jgi:hypothetical protein
MSDRPCSADRIELLHANLKKRGVEMTDNGTRIVLDGEARFLDDRTQAIIARNRGAFRALLAMDCIVAKVVSTPKRL